MQKKNNIPSIVIKRSRLAKRLRMRKCKTFNFNKISKLFNKIQEGCVIFKMFCFPVASLNLCCMKL